MTQTQPLPFSPDRKRLGLFSKFFYFLQILNLLMLNHQLLEEGK